MGTNNLEEWLQWKKISTLRIFNFTVKTNEKKDIDEGFDQIEEAHNLYEDGILTLEEFNKIKGDRLKDKLEPSTSLSRNLESISAFYELRENGILSNNEFDHLMKKFLAVKNFKIEKNDVLEAIELVHEYVDEDIVTEETFSEFKTELLAEF